MLSFVKSLIVWLRRLSDDLWSTYLARPWLLSVMINCRLAFLFLFSSAKYSGVCGICKRFLNEKRKCFKMKYFMIY